MKFILNLLFSYFLLLKLKCEGCLPMKNIKINITFNEDSINIGYKLENISTETSKIPDTKTTTDFYYIETSSEKPIENENLNKNDIEKAAKSLSEYVDKSVDPCDDFYEFTCGNFIKNNPAPNNSTAIGPIIGNYKEFIEYTKSN